MHPKERKPNQIGTRPEERALLARLFDAGLVDIGRSLDPDNNELFTFWAPWRNLRQRNIGWRIDYVLATPAARGSRADVGVPAGVRHERSRTGCRGVRIMSLRTRLVLAFFLLSVVPLAAVTIYSYITNVEALRVAARARSRPARRRTRPAHAARDGAAVRARRAPDGHRGTAGGGGRGASEPRRPSRRRLPRPRRPHAKPATHDDRRPQSSP